MKVVYVAHQLSAPTREGIEANRRSAALWCAWVAQRMGVAPIADWIILSGVWDETTENRRLGLAIDVELVARADELWLLGPHISQGMHIEAKAAQELGKPVVALIGIDPLLPDAELIDAFTRRGARSA